MLYENKSGLKVKDITTGGYFLKFLFRKEKRLNSQEETFSLLIPYLKSGIKVKCSNYEFFV